MPRTESAVSLFIPDIILSMKNGKADILRFWNGVMSFSGRKKLFSAGDSILLAVSGGPDSVAMLDFFVRAARSKRLRLKVCHINHCLRGKESDGDEAFVRKLSDERGIPAEFHRADVKAAAAGKSCGLEQAARTIRYRLLAKAAAKDGFNLVAAGHHADDHAETVLLNLLRGTEPKGLLGIPCRRLLCRRKSGGSIYLIRPLLGVRRPEVEAYMKALGLKARKDSSNSDDYFTRNWIRKKLLPMMEKKQPKIREHLAELSAKLAAEQRKKED